MSEDNVKRKYTMSEKALNARQKPRKSSPKHFSEEHLARLREWGEATRKPPRIRVMVDKALAEKARERHGNIDEALAYSLK